MHLSPARSFFAAALLTGVLAGDPAAPPAIEQASVVNAASHMPPSLPSGSIARGSRFIIRGLRLSPVVTVAIGGAGQAVNASILSAGPEKIEAQMPENAPLGDVELIVSSDGGRSHPYPLRVIESSFGIFTANGKGWGPLATESSATPITTPQHPAHPGETLSIWGTGLGVSPGAIQVTVGGIPATHASFVRLPAGLDRIDFEIPASSPVGCWVPVQMQVRKLPSNVGTISISADDAPCADRSAWFAHHSAPGAKSGWIVLMRSAVRLELAAGQPVDFTVDAAIATLHQEKNRPLDANAVQAIQLVPPPGTCTAYAAVVDLDSLLLPGLVRQTVAGRNLDLGLKVGQESHAERDLDAGASFTVQGATGSKTVERSIHKPQVYTAVLGGNPPFTRLQSQPLFLSPGRYHLTFPGGSDIPRFDTDVQVDKSIQWTNQRQSSIVDRAQGFTVKWRAPQADSLVPIVAFNLDRSNRAASACICLVEGVRGSFRIPAGMLANIPETPGASELSLGFVAVGSAPGHEPQQIRAPSLDSAYAVFASMTGRTVRFR